MSNWQHIGALVAPILYTVESTRNAGQSVDSDRVQCQKKSGPKGVGSTSTALTITADTGGPRHG